MQAMCHFLLPVDQLSKMMNRPRLIFLLIHEPEFVLVVFDVVN